MLAPRPGSRTVEVSPGMVGDPETLEVGPSRSIRVKTSTAHFPMRSPFPIGNVIVGGYIIGISTGLIRTTQKRCCGLYGRALQISPTLSTPRNTTVEIWYLPL